ncbi:hypothetical protein ACFQ08_15270, partial [Streptosporangium algeriense]
HVTRRGPDERRYAEASSSADVSLTGSRPWTTSAAVRLSPTPITERFAWRDLPLRHGNRKTACKVQ